MSRNTVYMPDKGVSALRSFYDWIDTREYGNDGLLSDVFTKTDKILPTVVENEKHTSNKLIGKWLKRLDPRLSKSKIVCQNTEMLSTILNASYDSISKKLIKLAKENKLDRTVRQGWLTEFIDPSNEYYCSKLHNEIKKINPLLGSAGVKNRNQEKGWLVEYLRVAKKQPYPTTKFDKSAVDSANKKYPLGLKSIKPFMFFKTYCVPDSEYFDADCFELCFAACGLKVNKSDPDRSVKDLIFRVLNAGYLIDCPAWPDWGSYSNESLYFWFERYTDPDSKSYDRKFETELRKKFPQQFSKMSLKYQGFRFHDKRKDDFIEKLKKDPTITANEVRAFFQHDPVFKKIVDGIAVRECNRPALMREEMLRRIKAGINLSDRYMVINNEQADLRKLLIKYVKSGTRFTDNNFRNKVLKLDPILVKCIEEEYSNTTPNANRLVKTYNNKKEK